MNNNNETHNGWTNYETWRVNLEIFADLDAEDWEDVTGEWCKDYAEELVSCEQEESYALDYALAFLGPVNWYEIAEAINHE